MRKNPVSSRRRSNLPRTRGNHLHRAGARSIPHLSFSPSTNSSRRNNPTRGSLLISGSRRRTLLLLIGNQRSRRRSRLNRLLKTTRPRRTSKRRKRKLRSHHKRNTNKGDRRTWSRQLQKQGGNRDSGTKNNIEKEQSKDKNL